MIYDILWYFRWTRSLHFLQAIQWFHFHFYPLDEAIASRALFVAVSGSDGRKRFWCRLNNSKTVSDRPMCQFNGELIIGRLPNKPIPDPHVPQTEGLQIDDHKSSALITIVAMILSNVTMSKVFNVCSSFDNLHNTVWLLCWSVSSLRICTCRSMGKVISVKL